MVVYLNGPVPLRVLPAEPGQAEHRQPDGHLHQQYSFICVLFSQNFVLFRNRD